MISANSNANRDKQHGDSYEARLALLCNTTAYVLN